MMSYKININNFNKMLYRQIISTLNYVMQYYYLYCRYYFKFLSYIGITTILLTIFVVSAISNITFKQLMPSYST